MNIKPLRNMILVDEAEQETVSAGGIIIEGARSLEPSKKAVALAVGPDVEFVKEGDTLFVEWNKGKPVTVDGKKLAMISEDHVAAILDGDSGN